MTWVRRTPLPDPDAHRCAPPTREAVYRLPSAFLRQRGPDAEPVEHRETVPAGALGDLWRCDGCDTLWRVGDSCDDCDLHRRTEGRCVRGGYHPHGRAWRPATWWQRLTHRRQS